MEKVIVLMSTYNGESYIRQQIDSIFAQKDVDINLIVRDDGSKDNTVVIINELRRDHLNIQLLVGSNKGFVCSFSELVDYAYHNTTAKFFAFVDQDDVWYPEKFQVACKKLSEYPEYVPNLFCSNSDIIDANGNRTGKKFRNYTPKYTRGNVLMYPLFQGCSMVFNRKALELYFANQPRISYHDRWMYLICHFLGNVYYEPHPLFAYRVHCNNALGIVGHYTFIQKCLRLWNMFFKIQVSKYYAMNEEFYIAFSNMLCDQDLRLFRYYLSYKHSFHSKLYMLFSSDFRTPIPTLREKIIYYPHVLLDKM